MAVPNPNVDVSVHTQRKKEKLALDGYLYVFDSRLSDGALSWRCDREMARNVRCLGRVHTEANKVLRCVKNVHGCQIGGDTSRIEAARATTAMKRRAATTLENPIQIRDACIQNLSVAALGQLPSENSSRRMIQRERVSALGAPANPPDRNSIVIPARYRYCVGDNGIPERFLLGDSGANDPNRVLVFGKESVGRWIHLCDRLFMDGTFSLAPPLFSQVFVVLAKRGDFVFPVATALLGDKTENSYRKVLLLLKAAWPRLAPMAVSCDYEKALINAVEAVLPGASIDGCLFHLHQNILKRVAQHGLMARYHSATPGANIKLQVQKICALAFVPPYELEEAIEVLQIEFDASMKSLLNDFLKTYMGEAVPNTFPIQRSAPLFPPGIWNVYYRTIAQQDRTNNYAEAAHRRLQAQFNAQHPSIYKFLDGLKTSLASSDARMQAFYGGADARARLPAYIQRDRRFKTIINRYLCNQTTIGEFLTGIAHQLGKA